jgi:catechol 2,3-dioxygenase-like lactoylglutathione lyase family enzyme
MPILGVLETAIYVRDMAVAVEFYDRLFGFETLDKSDQFCAYNVGGRSVLLLFLQGWTKEPRVISGGTIPAHGGDSPTHFAFAITAADLPAWEQRLAAAGIAIEGRVTWDRGGQSIYFRDPDNNLLELATPGVWAIY